MKPMLTRSQKRSWSTNPSGAEAVSGQEELVAAIRGALEAAVEMAIGEVRSLLETRDSHEELRRENESLKEQLQRAEFLLDSGPGSPDGLKPGEEPTGPDRSQRNTGVRGSPGGHGGTNLHLKEGNNGCPEGNINIYIWSVFNRTEFSD